MPRARCEVSSIRVAPGSESVPIFTDRAEPADISKLRLANMPGESELFVSEVFYEPFKEAVSIVFKDYNDRIPDHMTQAMRKIIITHLSNVSQQKMKGVFYKAVGTYANFGT